MTSLRIFEVLLYSQAIKSGLKTHWQHIIEINERTLENLANSDTDIVKKQHQNF